MGASISARKALPLLLAAVAAYLAFRKKKALTGPSQSSTASQQQQQRSPDGLPMPPRPTRAPPRPMDSAAGPGGMPPPPPSRPPPRPKTDDAPVTVKQINAAADVEFWICLDFEWTCDEDSTEHKRRVHGDEGEIIEFSFVVFDAKKGQKAAEGQYYCKNTRTPITDFCTNLTGISQTTIDEKAGTLEDALQNFEKDLEKAGAKGKRCCAVAHGSADLELMLPANCKAAGLKLPTELRRYVDLREATQTYVASTGAKGVRASSLRQICDALNVEMIGEEHCGLDDSWMVLLATQQLLQLGAQLRPIDLEAEANAFSSPTCPEQALCLDGLPFHGLAPEIRTWLERNTGVRVARDAVQICLGNDGRPSGRAIVDFGCHDLALVVFRKMVGGRCILCGTVDTWPFEAPRERLILVRPLRVQERAILGKPRPLEGGPGLAPFPETAQEMDLLRRGGKGNGKGRDNVKPAQDVEGAVRLWKPDTSYGFIRYPEGDVFVHANDCPDNEPLREGQVVRFDIVEDSRSRKMRASNVRFSR